MLYEVITHAPAQIFAWTANRNIFDAVFDHFEQFFFAELWDDLHLVGFDRLTNLVRKIATAKVVVFLGEMFKRRSYNFV